MTLPSPEEFAIENAGCRKVTFSVPSDGPIQHGCEAHGYWWPCPYSRDTTTAIAARDEAVRADERARVLAGFEWEERHDGVDFKAFPGPRYGVHRRRLVGPWEEVGRDE